MFKCSRGRLNGKRFFAEDDKKLSAEKGEK